MSEQGGGTTISHGFGSTPKPFVPPTVGNPVTSIPVEVPAVRTFYLQAGPGDGAFGLSVVVQALNETNRLLAEIVRRLPEGN